MKLLSSMKKYALLILILLLAGTAFGGSGKGAGISHETLKTWVGKKVNVNYACCGESACVLIRHAELKEVSEKAIVVITKGSPFLIPKYLIKSIGLSE